MPEQIDIHRIVNAPKMRHSYYVCAEVRVREDWQTKQVEVEGTLGIAPNDTTVIEYPVRVWTCGYFNKGTAKQLVTRIKRELVAEMQGIGYTVEDLTEPISVKVPTGYAYMRSGKRPHAEV